MYKIFVLIALFSYATSNCPDKLGGADQNGTEVPYNQQCNGYIGGVCDTCAPLFQVLAGCTPPGIPVVSFEPAIPSVLYVGQFYNFTLSACAGDIITYPENFNIRLPPGLNFTYIYHNASSFENVYSLSGTPLSTSPFNTYILAYITYGACSFRSSTTFSIQNACHPSASSSSTSSSSSSSTSSPISSTSTTGSSSCSNVGYMRCAGSSQYQTCDHGSWQANQSCSSGLICKANGNFIYCDRP